MLFKSRVAELRLVITPSQYVVDADGHFRLVKGKTIQFVRNTYRTEDPDEIKFLMEHPLRKVEFDVVEDEVLQKAKDYQEAIDKKAEELNTDKLVSLEKKVEELSQFIDKLVSNQVSNIKSEVQKPKRMWKCKICNTEFKTPKLLSDHRKSVHSKNIENQELGSEA